MLFWLCQLFRYLVFALFSIIVAILTLLLRPFDPKGKWETRLLRLWAGGTLRLFRVKVKVSGSENVVPEQGTIYVSNHASYLDIFILLSRIPDNVRMIYKKTINRVPLISWAMTAADFVSLDRKNVRSAIRSFDKAAKKMQKGISFVVFPEGTRSTDGTVKEFKRGIFILAEKSIADIVPVSISGTFELMPRTTWKIKPGRVNLIIGRPMKFRKERGFIQEIRDVVISNMSIVNS
jgi:1-acyl-sn-glycerol-3-phosphate acyltransferase